MTSIHFIRQIIGLKGHTDYTDKTDFILTVVEIQTHLI